MKKEMILIALALFTLFLLSNAITQENNSLEINDTNTTYSNLTATNSDSLFEITNFIPKTFKVGDSQFNIRIKNNANTTKENIIALVSGRGFSTYEIIPIESINPGEEDYIIIFGNFRETGNITLTIKIENDLFYQNIAVISQENELDKKTIQEKEKIELINNLSIQLSDLKKKYYELESEYYSKLDNDYDISKVNLNDLRTYLRDSEIALINEDTNNAKAKIIIASEYYDDQRKKLDASVKKSSIIKLKDYAIIFSAIAGAILTFLAISEILRNKSVSIFGTIYSARQKIKESKKKRKKKRKNPRKDKKY